MNPPIPLEDALEKIRMLKNKYYFRRESEEITLHDSIGRELSETIFANSISPEFDIAAMDGFALNCEDKFPLKITGKVYAGDKLLKIKRGEALAITTGALLPEGADAVLKIEDAEVKNTNAVLIQGFMKELGCESTFIGTVPDNYEETKKMLLDACEKYDFVFSTGGVSVGERDYVPDIIEETGELVFHKVAIRPGKPLAVGIVKDKPVFGLPASPQVRLQLLKWCFAAISQIYPGPHVSLL